MSIDVNAIEQTVVVTAVGDEVNVNIIDQPVLVSVTDQIIEVEASGGTGPQGPAGAGVAAGGTTGQVLSKASGTNYDTVWVDAGAGTVYSVDASGSTGISVTGGPITGAGTLTITNTAPDQVVALTGAGTAVITGTYPNFTITSNDEFDGTVTSVNLTAGTGISVSGGPITGSGSISVTNTAPDQVISLTGGGTTTISGTYPNFTITSTDSKVGTVTSVDMTVPTGLTISGNPITSAGTLALALASGYSIPTTASQANWNTAYNDSITSASVSGTSTKTLTLNQQDGGTVTASWSDIDTGLTSVGLSMPSAFAVANSPLTSNGTLAVTGAGTSAQYVRGDGQLANFPTNGGGGSSVNYYLNGSVSQGTFGGDTYYEMSKTPIIGAGTNFTRTNAQGNGYIASFITDAGDPALLNIPGGNWNVEFYFQASSGGGNPSFYAELYKVSSSNVFTLIASGSTNPEGITNGTAVDQYFTSIPVPQTALLATDRIAVRIYVAPDGRNITLHTENSNLCEVLTTFSTGLNALNGLTDQVQYFATGTSGTDFAISSATDTHTFNLPIASGTNTGKLSNTDWTTFINKQNAITLTTFNASGSATFVSSVLNIPTYTLVGLGGEPAITAGATTQYFRGDKTFQTLDTSVVPENSNLYYTDTRARNAITLTTTGSSGASTYSGGTLNIPIYSLSGLGGVPTTRTLTINGTTYDLSADRSWTIPVHDAVTIGTANGLSLSTQVLSLGLASSSANGALSSTDWSTFNGKQNAITLTTTGTSGAATLVGSTLNIPQYADQFVGTVTSVSALTIGTTGTDLSSSVANGTTTPVITLNVPTASATNRGALSSADWTTFNSKQAALNGTGFVKISGTTISYDNTSYLPLTGGTLSSASSAETLRLVNTGTGYGLYNQSDSYFQGDVKFQSVSNTILKVDSSNKLIAAVAGTDYQAPITNPVTGTGTTNYLPKWTSGSAIGNSQIFDNGTNVGIGTVTPQSLRTTALDISNTSGTNGVGLSLSPSLTGLATIRFGTTAAHGFDLNYNDSIAAGSGNLGIYSNANSSYKLILTSGGNLLVNSTTDNGNRLQVSGNASFTGTILANDTISVVKSKSGTGVENPNLLTLRLAGTGAIGDSANINWRSSDNSYTIASINGISGADNVAYGTLAFSTRRITTDSLVEAMRIDNRGNLGLGVTPSAWGVTAFQRGSSSFFEYSTNNTIVASNYYYPGGANNLYMNNGYASFYQQYNGQHAWYNAPSGTAGNAITFTQAMTLTSGGNLLVGTTTDSGEKLQVSGVITSILSSGSVRTSPSDNAGMLHIRPNAGQNGYITFTENAIADRWAIGVTNGDSNFYFRTPYPTSTPVVTIASSGAATFSSSVTATAFIPSYNTSYYATDGTISNYSASNYLYVNGNAGGGLFLKGEGAGTNNIRIESSTSNLISFQTNGSERLRITSGGNLLVGTTTDSGEKLQVNGGVKIGTYLYLASEGTGSVIGDISTGNYLRFLVSNGEKMRIKSNGSVRYIPMATPGTAEAGDVYYDSTSNKLRCYNGTSWNDLF